ncbi:MAG: hypothetical protein ACT4N2_09450 [Hyphomicrobium sp.]
MSTETEALAKLAGRVPVAAKGRADTASAYKPPTAPAHVYLLAEHLDACLAAGEDLLATGFTWNAIERGDADATRNERAKARETFALIRAREMTLIGRVMRAREHAETLVKRDAGFRMIARLFLGGTVPFVEAVAELEDTRPQEFDTGNARTAYLRSRNLLAADAAAPLDGAAIRIGEEFLVANRIALGPLLDLVAAFLDALDARYDLFAEAASTEPAIQTPPKDGRADVSA